MEDEAMFNSISGLPLGVKWEIGRLVSMGRLTSLMLDDLERLTGSNAEAAPKTVETIFKEKARKIKFDAAFAAERKSQCPWEELDREEAALSVDPNAALGHSPAYPEGYYGGKVSFVGSIEEVGKGGNFKFNPLELNANQMLCKWASRFALGLSNSVPGPLLNPENVEEISDIISSADSNMTDGCGLSNLAFNLKLRFQLNLETMPCAVQGMLVLWPDSTQDDIPKISFRNPSQVKINYTEEAKAHPANSTVDILRFSRTTCPARLSPEVIINLEHNGVPAEVFVRMQETYIAQAVDELLHWAKEPGRDTPEVMLRLWKALEKSENVYVARRAREAAGRLVFADSARGLATIRLRTTRKKTSTPRHQREVHRLVARLYFRLSVLARRDCWDALEEGEIHFKSSRRQFLNSEGIETDIVIGDVLMTRNPCKVPTDVRKLKAVKHEKLHDLVDVIVCSVRGQRRLLDFLGG
ncbi:RNA dependent RNA polymerase-domain-containing protein, partial [Mycena sanguinolenta]